MYTALVAIQLVLAVGIIGLVLMQHGKGADAGAAFGSGSSGTVFGSRGSANFLSRSTGILAALFFVVSLALAVIVARGQAGSTSVVDGLDAPAAALAIENETETPVETEQPAAAEETASEPEAALEGAPE